MLCGRALFDKLSFPVLSHGLTSTTLAAFALAEGSAIQICLCTFAPEHSRLHEHLVNSWQAFDTSGMVIHTGFHT